MIFGRANRPAPLIAVAGTDTVDGGAKGRNQARYVRCQEQQILRLASTITAGVVPGCILHKVVLVGESCFILKEFVSAISSNPIA